LCGYKYVFVHCQNLACDQDYANLDCTIGDALTVQRQVQYDTLSYETIQFSAVLRGLAAQ